MKLTTKKEVCDSDISHQIYHRESNIENSQWLKLNFPPCDDVRSVVCEYIFFISIWNFIIRLGF